MGRLNLLLILLLIFPFFPNLVSAKVSETKSTNANDFINISGDNELFNFASSNKLAGNGSVSNPYVIQNYSINSNYTNGISIQSTTSYLLIKNNLINHLNRGIGIFIDNCVNVVLENNTVENSLLGIEFQSSSGNIISNTVLSSIQEGILINNSNSLVISKNYLNFNTNIAIDVEYSYNFNLRENIILNTNENAGLFNNKQDAGILIFYSSRSTIQNNIIVASPIVGLLISESCWNILVDSNILQNNQISIEGNNLPGVIISNNTLGSFWGNIFVESFSQTLIENNTIFEAINPIDIASQSNATVKDNFISNSNTGIYIDDNSNYNTVTENTFVNITNEDIFINTLPIGNTIFANNFLDKRNEIKQENLNNYWDNSTMGNFWGSYAGIGNQSYEIPNFANGFSNIYDNHPLAKPFNSIDNEYKINYAINLLKPYGNLAWDNSNDGSYIGQVPQPRDISTTQNLSNANPDNSGLLLFAFLIIGLVGIIGFSFTYSKTKLNSQINKKGKKLALKNSNENFTINKPSTKGQNKNLCPKCNSKVDKSDLFCFNCGDRIK